jgi:hypothetical protein
MNNSFTLQNKLIDLNASSFGQDSFLKYKINNNKVKNNNEMFFVTMPKFSTNNFIAPPSGLPEDVKNF